jgi:hypothetical protein
MDSLNPIGPESMSLNCLARLETKTENLTKKKTNTNQNLDQNLGNKISRTTPKQREETQEQPNLTKMIYTIQTNNNNKTTHN